MSSEKILICCLCFMLMLSCTKERGCKDILATNYNAEADINDICQCRYDGVDLQYTAYTPPILSIPPIRQETEVWCSWNDKKNVFAPKGRILTPDQALELFYNELSKSGEGITYLLAARYDEVSNEGPEFKHGAFTYYLLKGLDCLAQQDDNPIISIQELYDYLCIQD